MIAQSPAGGKKIIWRAIAGEITKNRFGQSRRKLKAEKKRGAARLPKVRLMSYPLGGSIEKAKGKRQKPKGKKELPGSPADEIASGLFHLNFCPLVFAFSLLPSQQWWVAAQENPAVLLRRRLGRLEDELQRQLNIAAATAEAFNEGAR